MTALAHRRPVLVAEGMTNAHGAFDDSGGRQIVKPAQVNVQNIAEIDPADHGPALRVIPEQHVAVAENFAPFQGDSQGKAVPRGFAQAAFLRVPLAEIQGVDVRVGQPGPPFRIVRVAKNCFNQRHDRRFLVGMREKKCGERGLPAPCFGQAQLKK